MFEYHQRAATDDYRENWDRLYGDRAKAPTKHLYSSLQYASLLRRPDGRLILPMPGEGPQPDDL